MWFFCCRIVKMSVDLQWMRWWEQPQTHRDLSTRPPEMSSCLHPHRKRHHDHTHTHDVPFACTHAVQPPPLSFGSEHTMSCHPAFTGLYAVRRGYIIVRIGLDRLLSVIVCYCLLLRGTNLLTNTINVKLGKRHYRQSQQSSNCIHYLKEKLWLKEWFFLLVIICNTSLLFKFVRWS